LLLQHLPFHQPGWNTWKWIVDNELPFKYDGKGVKGKLLKWFVERYLPDPEGDSRVRMFFDSVCAFLQPGIPEKIRRAYSNHPIKAGYQGRAFPKEDLQGTLDGVRGVSSHHAWAGLKAISEWNGVQLTDLPQDKLLVWSTNDRMMHPSISKEMTQDPRAEVIRTDTAHNHYSDMAKMVRDYLQKR
jgi:hypothetical protein